MALWWGFGESGRDLDRLSPKLSLKQSLDFTRVYLSIDITYFSSKIKPSTIHYEE